MWFDLGSDASLVVGVVTVRVVTEHNFPFLEGKKNYITLYM